MFSGGGGCCWLFPPREVLSSTDVNLKLQIMQSYVAVVRRTVVMEIICPEEQRDAEKNANVFVKRGSKRHCDV